MSDEELAAILGTEPQAPHFELALTHPSFANEQRSSTDNQRLEFLGDAILGFCTSEILFKRFPDAQEGELTRLRAKLVNASALARWAESHHVAEALRLGRGADEGGLRSSQNVLADAVEALIAAVFLDNGLDSARGACHQVVEFGLECRSDDDDISDPKSRLQEKLQGLGHPPPTYRVEEVAGPDHQRSFCVVAMLGDKAIGRGQGRSKRQAEFAAAADALRSHSFQENS